MSSTLPILNLHEARFKCTFGRGCEGVCCREGRPPVYPEELENIAGNLTKILPYLRPEARSVVLRVGFLVPRRRRPRPAGPARRAGLVRLLQLGMCSPPDRLRGG